MKQFTNNNDWISGKLACLIVRLQGTKDMEKKIQKDLANIGWFWISVSSAEIVWQLIDRLN